jgi:hypothetical protein
MRINAAPARFSVTNIAAAQNEQVRGRVEAMISRLKGMEQAS